MEYGSVTIASIIFFKHLVADLFVTMHIYLLLSLSWMVSNLVEEENKNTPKRYNNGPHHLVIPVISWNLR